jgi:hypothetical protein
MGVFTQQVYIPQFIYNWLPLLYLAAGVFLWIVLIHPVGRLAGLALVGFGVFILAKRFLKQSDYRHPARTRGKR